MNSKWWLNIGVLSVAMSVFASNAAWDITSGVTEANAAYVCIDGYIEIDDLDGLGPGLQDANLCSDAVVASPVCPTAGTAADNPNFPGPDPSNPNVLGSDDDYLDWADLFLANSDNFHYDVDELDPTVDDDVFKQDSCIGTAKNLRKANVKMVGIAANWDWMYLLTERDMVQGQEEWHFFFTQNTPRQASVEDCRTPTYVWDPVDGDVQVIIQFQNTSGLLPRGNVIVFKWEDSDGNSANDEGMLAEVLIRHENWVPLSSDVLPPVYIAFNVAPGPKSRDADVEYNLDGDSAASGQLVETAIDRDRVFGTACDISPTALTVITATSGLVDGKTNHLTDFFKPIAIEFELIVPGWENEACCD